MLVENSAQANINLNAKDKFGQTAFHLVCQIDHSNTMGKEEYKNQMIQLFIEKQGELNLELNAKSENGETALHLACKNVLSQITKLLIQVHLFQKLFFVQKATAPIERVPWVSGNPAILRKAS